MGALRGRAAIVTGASRGIGQAIAERFAGEGAAVVLVARTLSAGTSRLPGSIEETVDRITAAGGFAAPLQADLNDPDQVETIVERAEALVGPVDTLVNNAGVNFYGPAMDVPGRRYDLMFQMMVHAPFRLCQLAVPSMRAEGRGWILNITSKRVH